MLAAAAAAFRPACLRSYHRSALNGYLGHVSHGGPPPDHVAAAAFPRAAREEEAAREHGTPAVGPDGIPRSRLETGHRRLLSTLFGTVRVTRCAWRRPGAGNLYPADAALSLPAPRHSHTLTCLAGQEAAWLVRDRARRDH